MRDSYFPATVPSAFSTLLTDIRACTLCSAYLPLGPRPVVQAHPAARILLAGQAPGRKVHATGLPFNDPSGDRLRQWLGVDRDTFYDPRRFAIVPMGFCYPGTGKAGDFAPRPECSATWHDRLIPRLKNVELTLAIGRYAIAYHIQRQHPERRGTLTDIVRASDFARDPVLALPHPSPRNLMWLKRNAWFEAEFIPKLQKRVARLLAQVP